MNSTTATKPQQSTRRSVAGYILASIAVGVIGLVTAIMMTVSGIMNSYSDVSESYVDIFDTGVEVGPQTSSVELSDAKYTIVSFLEAEDAPSVVEVNQACEVTDPYGDPVSTNTTSQPIADTNRQRFGADLAQTQHVIFTHFEARDGSYQVVCEDYGLLSDGAGNSTGSTATQGILIGLGSMLVAAGLFVMGVVNSSRNKKAQDLRLPDTSVPDDQS